jgi:signal peptidase I
MVAGHSMEPTYQLGDAVIAWRQPVEIGDIILYRIPAGDPGEGKTVIHRVIGGDGNGWTTQGDNNPHPDEWHPTNLDVLGVAQTKVPLGGEVLAVVRSWWFIAAMGGVAIGLLLWPESQEGRRGRHRS